jgi:hypothetical protein
VTQGLVEVELLRGEGARDADAGARAGRAGVAEAGAVRVGRNGRPGNGSQGAADLPRDNTLRLGMGTGGKYLETRKAVSVATRRERRAGSLEAKPASARRRVIRSPWQKATIISERAGVMGPWR